MRIQLSDCDMPLATVDDVMNDLLGVTDPVRARFVPTGLERLAADWVILIELSKLLGDILMVCYGLNSRPTISQVEALERQLLELHTPGLDYNQHSRAAVFSHLHLQLHYQCDRTPCLIPMKSC